MQVILIPLRPVLKLRFSSVQFSCSVMSDSLWPHESQHSRPPCPSTNSGVHSESRPSSWWCHLAISSSIVPFSSCPQSPPASGSFPMSRLFVSRGQSVGASTLASVFPVNIQGWFPLGLTSLIPLLSQGTLQSLLQHHNLKASVFRCLAFFRLQLPHLYMTMGKTTALTIQTFVSKVMSLLYNMLSRFVIVFLPRSKCLGISWLHSLSTVILEPKKIKSATVSIFFPVYLPWSDWFRCHDLVFRMLSFKAVFFTLLFLLHQEALSFLFAFCH